jgi:hypothetical protein
VKPFHHGDTEKAREIAKIPDKNTAIREEERGKAVSVLSS